MKTTLLTLNLLLLALMPLSAGIHPNAGEYGYQFLDISTNPVALALAGRGIHAGTELASFVRQPASSALESHRSLGVSHSLWLADTKYNNLYYSYSDRRSHLGLALRQLDYGELEIRDDNGYLIGQYSPLNMDLMGNYALRLTPAVYAGLNAGVAYEKLNTDSSLGLHGDLGLTWLPPVRNTRFSLAWRNLGLSSKMNEEATLFAPSLELDLSKQFLFDSNSLIVELSGIKAVDENWKAAASAQFALYDMVLLRVGYKYNHDAEDLSAGLGFRWRNIGIDYGWASFSSRLSDVHSFGLSYNF
ncbi:MAG: PorV/PorQ family protein [Candidatus Syntrophosphaera sp.]|nr:PorV/PorQ family protein [Candidatus Syntrophosphaera sp.]